MSRSLTVAAALAAGGQSHAAFISSTYIGANGGNWNLGANWSAGVPNNGIDTFEAVIPAAKDVVMNLSPTVDSITIGAGGKVAVANSFDATLLVGPLSNDGTFELGSAGSATDLRIGADIALVGSGQLSTTNSTANRVLGTGGVRRLTNGVGHTIRGALSLGANLDLTLSNLGLIESTLSQGITIDLVGTELDNFNDGTIQSNGAPLTFVGTGIDNSFGEIVALDASETRFGVATTIVGGLLRSEGTGLLRLTGNASFHGTSLQGTLTLGNSIDATLKTSLGNQGSVQLNSAGSATDLILDGDVTLFGSGEVLMGNNSLNRIIPAAGTPVLTNASGHTIRGAGSVGANLLRLSNSGLIEATLPVGMTIDLVGTTTDNFNDSIIQANGADLSLTGTGLDNTFGEIVAKDGSDVILNGSTILGGTLRTEGTGEIRVGAAPALDSVRLEGALVLGNGNDVTVRLSLENAGVLSVGSTGAATDVILDGDVTLFGSGEVLMGNSTLNRIVPAAGTPLLTNASGHTIRGAGSLGSNLLRLSNSGLIEATLPAGMTIDLVGTAADNFNDSTIQANGGNLSLTGTAIDNTFGEIVAKDSEVRLSNPTIHGGLLRSEGSGLFRVIGAATIESVALDGVIAVDNTTDLTVLGTIGNEGEIQLKSISAVTQLVLAADTVLAGAGEVTMTNSQFNRIDGAMGARLTNSATHTIRGAGSIGVNNLDITNQGVIMSDQAGTLIIDPQAEFLNEGLLDVLTGNVTIGSGAFVNSGAVFVNPSRTLTRSSSYVQTGGLTRVDGILAMSAGGSTFDLQGGLLQGSGTISGAGDDIVNSGGTVAPGDSVGTLSAGSYTQGAGGTFEVEIAAGGISDRLQLIGAATLAGTLDVYRSGAYVPTAGDTFTIISCGSRSGEFDAVLACDPVQVIYSATSVKITIVSGSGIPGDFNGDGEVDGADLGALLAAWGGCGGACCNADLNGDFIVDGADLGILLANWT